MNTGDLIAKRYRVERLVGSGGAAEVYEVVDVSSGERLALKRLVQGQANGKLAEVMLAREYNALAQLAHPLIIRAFDYGRDGTVPYYTMELLSGENLRDAAPLEWREACHVLRDVASALGIIHSRKLLHRDVTTRNVCRVADGRAKLIDFGALTPMGRLRDIVGTPPFVPPEALDEQRLDGRADLFALGAVAYYVLTGKHAYYAHRFRELIDVWRFPVAPPSSLSSDVPPALDELVLSLLALARSARPQNAAEVFQRLTAIADLPAVEGPDVAQAYLATPSLIGRDRALGVARRYTERLRRGRGAVLLLEGESGVGRTRLLGAFSLEAKLRGCTTARVGARDVDAGPFHVVRALVRELFQGDASLPDDPGVREAARFAEVLAEAPSTEEDWHGLAQRIADLLARVAERTPLMMSVDDVDVSDDPSLATLSLAARYARSLPLALFCTAERSSRGKAMSELRRTATSLGLSAFTRVETGLFVSSLFGEVPHVDGIAEWMHRLAQGNARASLELSQHLVDRAVARYQEGAWVLPASIDGLGLPQTVEQAMEQKVAALGPAARELLETLSLTTEHEPLLVTEYAALFEHADVAPAFEALNELIAGSFVVGAGAAYVIAQRELAQVMRRSVAKERAPALHRRLARAYASGSGEGTMLVVYHLYHSGDLRSAFAAAVRAVSLRIHTASRGAALSRSREGARITESLFVWGIDNRMPRRDLVLLGRSLLQLASVVDAELVRHADLVIEPLRKETGLVYLDELAHVRDPTARVQACLGRAFADYEATPEPLRGLGPAEAISELATCAAMLVGVYAQQFDAERATELGELLRPFCALSPAVDVIAEVIECARRALRGFYVLDRRLALTERVAAPVPGLDDLSRQGLGLICRFYLALDEASYGREIAAERVVPLDDYPHTAPLAWQARMLLHLFRGEDEKAAEARRRRDAASIGRLDVDQHFEFSVVYEAFVSYTLGDLLSVGRSLAIMSDLVKTRPAWVPYLHALKGNYHALRGEMTKALEEHRRAHAMVPVPGVHPAWGQCVNSLSTTLIEVGRADEAEAMLERAIAEAAPLEIAPYQLAQIEMNLALSKASLGKSREANELADRAVRGMRAANAFGVVVLEHYVRRALVALRTADTDGFNAALRVVEQMCAETPNPFFAAKHEYLLRQVRSTGSFRPAPLAQMEIVTRRESHTTAAVGLRVELENCGDSSERAARGLGVILEWSGADGGFLYLYEAGKLKLASSSPGLEPPEFLEQTLYEWLQAFISGGPTSRTASPLDPGSAESLAFDVVAIVTFHAERPLVVGVAALGRSRPGRPIPESVLDAIGEALTVTNGAIGMALRS
ncbi:MAG TPA: protein kinase [Polyangiaceae bacterium]|nr:protein kinase [Polyangiaceae bacterium]